MELAEVESGGQLLDLDLRSRMGDGLSRPGHAAVHLSRDVVEAERALLRARVKSASRLTAFSNIYAAMSVSVLPVATGQKAKVVRMANCTRRTVAVKAPILPGNLVAESTRRHY